MSTLQEEWEVVGVGERLDGGHRTGASPVCYGHIVLFEFYKLQLCIMSYCDCLFCPSSASGMYHMGLILHSLNPQVVGGVIPMALSGRK